MKKLFAVLMSVLMLAALSSCGSTEKSAESAETVAVETPAEPTGAPAETEAAETEAVETEAVDEEEPTEGAPYAEDGRLMDEEAVDMLELAGLYNGTNGGELDLSMYTDADTVAVGTFELTDEDGSLLYSGEIQEAMTNYYSMLDADLTMTVYTEDGTLCLDVWADGEHLDYFTMAEHYVS